MRELRDFVSDPRTTPVDCVKALNMAYDLGLAEGRIVGGSTMGDALMAAYDRGMATMRGKSNG